MALVSWTGCSSEEVEESDVNGVPVEILQVELQAFQDQLDLTGTLETDDDATLSAQTAGRLQSREALGEQVDRGTVVARIDPTQAQAAERQARAQLRSAQSAYEQAQDSFDRQEPLYRDSVISAIEFEGVRAQLNQAEAQVEQAEAALEQAQDQLANTGIEAPFAGTIEEHFATTGEEIAPGTPVLRMVNTERMYLTVGVPERYINDIDREGSVDVRFRSLGNEAIPGTIRFVGGAVDPVNRTFRVEVELKNDEGRLHPDMVGRVLIPREQLDNVIVVPRRAIERDEDGYRLYVVTNPEGEAPRVESRLVTLGPTSQGRTAILDGLSPDVAVIVTGQSNVAEGDTANIVERYATLNDAMIDPGSTQRPVANTR
ncbi:MAG: efflux RND transporter periplasmic adaptor subunit [Longimonas sp.]|uniref:efflux RND transporter periplasmic adaptor subunit n=1 Tax=Longimonas sp. TaxID=2039626 RepID=UPI003974A803